MMKTTVLVINGRPENIYTMLRQFHNLYNLIAAASIAEALRTIESIHPDVILLECDFCCSRCMEVWECLKSNESAKDIPVILMLENSDMANVCQIAQSKVEDYIIKPINYFLLRRRIDNCIRLNNALSSLTAFSVQSNDKLANVDDIIIIAMASLAETRDDATGDHIKRTQFYVRELANRLKTHPLFEKELSDQSISLIAKSAPLHDIGKVGIPDSILLKPDKLTPEEFEIMKTHTTIGLNAINTVENIIGSSNTFVKFAKEIIHYHHERWDGSGYPQALSGDKIPISARLMSIADVYDALVSKRVYKDAYSHEHSVEIIAQGRGTHFDPHITDAFLSLEKSFKDISASFSHA
ncbi:MAG: HD domain-containing phosphohydrolase [Oscillospiraceae bacterium]|jgi:putative two-component system response regulator